MEKTSLKRTKIETLILAAILAIGAFFRLYKIDGYMTFLGDEGRDAIIVRRLLTEGDLILIGPGTSIGNMYLGPLYYYLSAPFLLLTGFSPVGPSVMVALLGILTILMVWYIGREWFGAAAGIFAAALYAVAPTVIVYSRSSWNPNIMPFFSLLTIYALWNIWQKSEFKWLLVAAVSFAFVLQSHYLGLLIGPLILLIWLLAARRARREKARLRKLVLYSLAALAVFSFLMSPLLIFDMRHGWINSSAVAKFFTERQTTVSARPWNALPKAWPLIEKINTRLLAGRDENFGRVVALTFAAGLAWLFGAYKVSLEKKEKNALLLIFLWMGLAIVGLGVYKQEIYDHYYGFFFPAPFLLLGGLMGYVAKRHKIRGWWLAGSLTIILLFYNLKESPLKSNPAYQLQRSIAVAEKIVEESRNEKFNLAVIAERNYEDAYQYFLEKWETKFTEIDPQNTKETISEQLFVVCELPAEKCDPTHNAKAEVANFGWSRVESEWEIFGVRLYKLVHYES